MESSRLFLNQLQGCYNCGIVSNNNKNSIYEYVYSSLGTTVRIKDVSMFHIRDTKELTAGARLLTSYYIFKACRLSSIVLAPIYNMAWGPVSAAETAIMICTTS